MNSPKNKELNWRKLLWLGVLVAVVAYGFGEPYLENWLGIDLPSIRENGDPVAESVEDSSESAANSSEPFLIPTGKKNRLRSPAGLVYGESRGEHRVDHVMRHAIDDKNRPVHSVFDGSKAEILKIIDEAYELVQSKSSRVKTSPDQRLDFRVKHTVDMKRKIGYLGGQRGKRENYPPRSKLTLILDNGKFVITAYPDR